MSLLHEEPSNGEIIRIYVNFEWLGEIKELQHMGR